AVAAGDPAGRGPAGAGKAADPGKAADARREENRSAGPSGNQTGTSGAAVRQAARRKPQGDAPDAAAHEPVQPPGARPDVAALDGRHPRDAAVAVRAECDDTPDTAVAVCTECDDTPDAAIVVRAESDDAPDAPHRARDAPRADVRLAAI